MKIKIILKLISNLFKKPITVRFPKESIPLPDGYRGKHFFTPEKCLGCGNCANICPNKAIEMVEVKQKDGSIKRQPRIDLSKCSFCGLCQEVCPTGALKLNKKIPLAGDHSPDIGESKKDKQ